MYTKKNWSHSRTFVKENILQRSASIVATILPANYRKSPLVQSGLEIPFWVVVFKAETVKNKEIIQKFKDMVDAVDVEPDGSVVIGSFAHHSVNMQ